MLNLVLTCKYVAEKKKKILEPEGILKTKQMSFGSILLLMELEIEGL